MLQSPCPTLSLARMPETIQSTGTIGKCPSMSLIVRAMGTKPFQLLSRVKVTVKAFSISYLPDIFQLATKNATMYFHGGDMASTWYAKPKVHAEVAVNLVKHAARKIVANDDNYALAA